MTQETFKDKRKKHRPTKRELNKLRKIAVLPIVDCEAQIEMIEVEDISLTRMLACNPNLCLRAQLTLAGSPDWIVLDNLLNCNCNVSHETVEAIVENTHLPTLKKLVYSPTCEHGKREDLLIMIKRLRKTTF